jgi:hypothetical protein
MRLVMCQGTKEISVAGLGQRGLVRPPEEASGTSRLGCARPVEHLQVTEAGSRNIQKHSFSFFPIAFELPLPPT